MEEAVKERENLYKLIISQLRYDGCEAIASNLAKTTNIVSPCPPSARLHQVVNLGLRAEAEGTRPENLPLPGLTNAHNSPIPCKGIDLEYEPEEYAEQRNGQGEVTRYMNELTPKKSSTFGSDSGGDSDRENIPPSMEVHEHILKITKSKIAIEEINVVRSNGEIPVLNPEDLNTDNVCARVKRELQKMNISQEVFAKCVLGKTQGYLSEMLKHGEKVFYSPDKANSKGRMNFEKMRLFLARPEEERRAIYLDKARQLKEERFSRKRMSLTMAFYGEDGKEFYPTPSKTMAHSSNYSNADATPSPSFFPQIIKTESLSNRRPPSLIKSELVSPKREVFDDRPMSRRMLFNPPSDKVFVTTEASRFAREPPMYVMCKTEPAMTPPRSDKNSEFSLVTSKIAALSRKQPTPTKIKLNERIQTAPEKEPSKLLYSVRPRETRRQSDSESSSCGIPEDVVTIETLSLQSLAAHDMDHHDNPLVLQRESFDPSKVEIGQNLYVVQVDRTDAISVTSSL